MMSDKIVDEYLLDPEFVFLRLELPSVMEMAVTFAPVPDINPGMASCNKALTSSACKSYHLCNKLSREKYSKM